MLFTTAKWIASRSYKLVNIRDIELKKLNVIELYYIKTFIKYKVCNGIDGNSRTITKGLEFLIYQIEQIIKYNDK